MDHSTKKINDLLQQPKIQLKESNFTKRNNPRMKTQKEKLDLDNYIKTTMLKIQIKIVRCKKDSK
jgi:hypothetical protein